MTKNYPDTYKDALKYLHDLEHVKGIKLGLENILKLLESIKNPQKSFKAIHIAGTNGKGSTSAMISSILVEAGFKTGLYTSPHLIDFRERIAINGEKIPEEDVVRILNEIKPFISHDLTSFEVVTAIAFVYFSEKGVDFAVLEVGMGGRLDATNVVNPLVSVITNIALEHEEYLGKKLLQIAGEKAGVIKENSILVTAEKNKENLDLIKKICRGKNTKIICVGEDGEENGVKYERLNYDLYSQEFYYFYRASKNENRKIKFNIPLTGKHQMDNASCAISAVIALREYNIKISDNAICEGLKKTQWKGRCEIIRENPIIILDVAHNPAGILALSEALFDIKEISGYKNLILIIGILKSKDFKKMLEIIAPFADKIILTKPDTSLALDTESMYEYLIKSSFKENTGNNILIKEKVSVALEFALSEADNNDAICITGSFYTIGNAVKHINAVFPYKNLLTGRI